MVLIMAKTEYTTIGGGLIDADREMSRRYFLLKQGVASKKRFIYTRDQLANLPSYSLLTQCADAWNALSDAERTAWNEAGAVCSLQGYNLFVQDKSYRLKHSLAGNATPSLFHQYLIGHLSIPEGAGDCAFKQENLNIFTFPASIYISAKTSLTADPANGEYIKVSFIYEYDEGGGLQYDQTDIVLPLSADWADYSESLTEHTGLTGNWVFRIETHAVKGDFFFDNILVVGGGGLITKDPLCEKVNKRWMQELAPEGVAILSEYPE